MPKGYQPTDDELDKHYLRSNIIFVVGESKIQKRKKSFSPMVVLFFPIPLHTIYSFFSGRMEYPFSP
jgi:hypothetical protein